MAKAAKHNPASVGRKLARQGPSGKTNRRPVRWEEPELDLYEDEHDASSLDRR